MEKIERTVPKNGIQRESSNWASEKNIASLLVESLLPFVLDAYNHLNVHILNLKKGIVRNNDSKKEKNSTNLL